MSRLRLKLRLTYKEASWRNQHFLGQSATRNFHSTSFKLFAESEAPSLLQKLRQDLKSAMQTKDQDRLNALRGVLADITNASKTSSPPTTDIHLLALLRKRIMASKSAGDEFAIAKRTDLKEKEDAQIAILEKYVGNVDVITDGEIGARIQEVVRDLKLDQGKSNTNKRVKRGDVMKKLLGPGGIFNGKPMENPKIARMVDAALET